MGTLLRLYKAASKYWLSITVAAICYLAMTGINLLTPWLTGNVFRLLESGDYSNGMNIVITTAILLLSANVARSGVQFLSSYMGHFAAWNYVADVRVRIYAHLQKLSMGYYSDKQTGQLMSRVVNDTASFEVLIAHAIPELVSGVLLFVGVMVILFAINPVLAAITCAPIPFLVVTTRLLRKVRGMHRIAQSQIAELNATLQDNFSGMKEIQIFNMQSNAHEKVETFARGHATSVLKALLLGAIMHPSIAFLTSVGQVVVVGVGGYMALNDMISASQLVMFLLYLSQFYAPVGQLARIIEDMQSGIACGERVFEVLDTMPEITDAPGAKAVKRQKGRIKFEDVSFSYGDEGNILENIDFTVPEKKMFAIVGPTGVGKTTLVALLPRFYDATLGNIYIDDKNIKNITLASLRDQISMVLQDVFLFNGTIKDNIMIGKPNATMKEVVRVAKMACIHDFIQSLADGYDTMVGERGVRLSGGQKQRISLARALLCDSPILVLDEATSAVDTETELEIQNAIQNISGSRTMIVIAHRLSTVKKADCIIVLSGGRIHEMGNHDELIAKKGLYSHLVDIQNIKE